MHTFIRDFLLTYVRYFARIALQKHNVQVIGVAGSVGKSSACKALFAILSDHFPTKIIAGNSETGIPLGLLGIEVHSLGFSTPMQSLLDWGGILLQAPFGIDYLQHTKYIIVEMGIDEPNPPKNMEYLLTILKPDIAIELNIAPPHLGQFEPLLSGKTVENKREFLLDRMAEEDIKIISQSGCRIGIYNGDDARVTQLIKTFAAKETKTTLLSFGKQKDTMIVYKDYVISEKQTQFSFAVKQDKKMEDLTLVFPGFLLPQEYQETFAAVILASLQSDLSLSQIKTSLEKNFSLPYGRASVFTGVHNTTLIDSSYNASPKAVSTFLQMLKALKQQTKRPAVFLFGDMRELGSEEQGEHEKIAKEIAGVVDYLYCVGPLTRRYVIQEVEENNKNLKEIRWFDSSKRGGEYLQENVPKNAIVLIKGSQNTIYLEEAIKYLLKDKNDERKLCRQESYWLEKKHQTS